MTTELPYAADAEVSLAYDELEVSTRHIPLLDIFVPFRHSSHTDYFTSESMKPSPRP